MITNHKIQNIKNTIKNSFLYNPLNFVRGKLLYRLPVRLRYGKVFTDTQRFLNESEFWPEEKIKQYQLEQLNKLINHAYENVPYYTKLFDNNGITPGDINDFKDLRKIPYLTKEIINQHREELISKYFPKKYLCYVTTGGSTGIPLGFYHDQRLVDSLEWAFMTHQWKRIGYNFRDKCVVLRGSVVKNIKENDKYWETNRSNNWLLMSSYHLTDKTIPIYINKIRDFRPCFIQAYPSVLQLLVVYMKNNHIRPFESVKAIFCGSENLYQWQRKLFEEVLKTKVYSWYGHTERVCLAGECEHSKYYHSFPQYGFLELINEHNEWCNHEDEKGEIVATGFGNYVMPFIRYKTQDIAIYTNRECSCGRKWKLIKGVEGRLQDYVIGKNNEKITLTALIFAQHFHSFGKIKNMQLYQKNKGIVEVRIVEKFPLTGHDHYEIKNKMVKASDSSLSVEIKTVDDIPRTKGGKYRFLIQELPIQGMTRVNA